MNMQHNINAYRPAAASRLAFGIAKEEPEKIIADVYIGDSTVPMTSYVWLQDRELRVQQYISPQPYEIGGKYSKFYPQTAGNDPKTAVIPAKGGLRIRIKTDKPEQANKLVEQAIEIREGKKK